MRETTLEPKTPPLSPARIARGLTLDEARDLLDWLEAGGIDDPEFDIEELGVFTVRWE